MDGFDYDNKDQRVNINGSLTSRAADNQLVSNLRFKFKDSLDLMSDKRIVDTYDLYALSEDFGDDVLWLNHWTQIDT